MPKRQKRPLKSHYPPYKRNRLRWALHCYRWKQGLPWEHYAYIIATELGLEEKGEGLNKRDPYAWIIEGQNPSPKKLSIYEKFIRKVAPEHAKGLSEDGFAQTLGDFVSGFINDGEDMSERADSLMEAAGGIEGLTYVTPFPTVPSVVRPFSSEVSVLAFRRIGQTPYLKAYAFGLDDPSGPSQNKANPSDALNNTFEKFLQAPKANLGDARDDTFEKFMQARFDDTIPLTDFNTGILVPENGRNRYVGILRNLANKASPIHLTICNWDRQIDPETRAAFDGPKYKEIDFKELHLDLRVIKNDGLLKDENKCDSFAVYMRGVSHDAIQNMIEAMRLP